MWIRTLALAVALLAAPGASELVGQGGGTPGSRMMGPRGDGSMRTPASALPGAEVRIGRVLDRRHTLSLSDEQVRSLSALQAEAAERLRPLRDEMVAVREGRRDGSLTLEQTRERLDAARTAWREANQAIGARLDETLEPRQRALLRAGAMRAGTGRPGLERGRREAREGRGFRPRRDVRERGGPAGGMIR
jgi:hypothetical protein